MIESCAGILPAQDFHKRLDMNKKTLVYSLILMIIISLCACESDIPLYKARESKKSILVKSDYRIEDFYVPDVNVFNDTNLYTDTIILDKDQTRAICVLIDNAINYLYNLNYAQDEMNKLEELYSFTSPLLGNSIRNSNYFSNYMSNIKQYKVVFSIPYRNFTDDSRVFKYVLDSSIIYAVPVQLYLDTSADNSFYEKYPYYIKGDTRLVLWFYILYVEESEYKIIAWTESFFENDDEIKTLVFSEKEVSYE